MDISKQVSSLEQAKRLKELGVKRESFFTWQECYLNEDENGKTTNHWCLFVKNIFDDYGASPVDSFPDWWDEEECEYGALLHAYTVAELGEMLPKRWEAYWTESYNLGCGEWRCDLYKRVGDSHSEVELSKYGSTEAEARCAMLIHLLETGALKPEVLNNSK